MWAARFGIFGRTTADWENGGAHGKRAWGVDDVAGYGNGWGQENAVVRIDM